VSILINKIIRKLFALFLLFSFCSVHAAEVNGFIGAYQGDLKVKSIKQAYPVEISLWLTAENQIDGFVLSVGNSCSARLRLHKLDGKTLILNESNTNNRCTDSRLALAFSDANTLSMKRLSLDNKILATASLKKGKESPSMRSMMQMYLQQSNQNERLAKQYIERQKLIQKLAVEKYQRKVRQIPGLEDADVTASNRKNRNKNNQQSKGLNNQSATKYNTTKKARHASASNRQRIDKLDGYWAVSGLDGTLSKTRVITSGDRKQTFEIHIVEPRGFLNDSGYRKNDILAIGDFYPYMQQLLMVRNYRRSGDTGDFTAKSSCRIIRGVDIQYRLLDISHIANQSGVYVFRLKRMTPANKICKYSEFSELGCNIARCREYATEQDYAKEKQSKDFIFTNSFEFAKQYRTDIHYQGNSFQEQRAKMNRAVNQKEIKAYMNMWGVISGQPNDWTRKYRKQKDKRRVEQLIQKGKRHQAFADKVENIKQTELQIPDAATCDKYTIKNEYNSFNEAALYGVKPGMLLKEMHDALMCNGFKPDAKKVAMAGGLNKYLGVSGKIVYQKTRKDGMKLTTEIGVVPLTYKQRKSRVRQHRIKTFSVLHKPTTRLDDSEWEKIKTQFLDQYDVGGRKSGNQYIVTLLDQRRQMSVSLQAKYTRQRSIYGYHITVCCGK